MGLAIRTENLSKRYRRNKKQDSFAIKNLNLEIKEGQTFGFIGPNGAGKTSTIKILTGLSFATSGKASIFEQSVSKAQARKYIGYLPEVAAYSPQLEALEILTIFAKLHELPSQKIKTRCLEVLKLVGLEERKQSRLGEFSKGMLQRIGIAQALLHEPKLLILDEPTSGLDPIAQREVLDILRSLKAQGITIFFSSHRLVEVEGLCDYVGIVSLGDLIFSGTTFDLASQDVQTPYIVRFKQTSGNEQNWDFGSAKKLEKNTFEVIIEPTLLDQKLNQIHEHGGSVVSVLPQYSPLEDIFVSMIKKHQGGRVIS